MQDTPFCYRKNSRGLFKICEKEANPTSKCWQASHLMQWKTHYWNLPKTWVLFQPLILILLNWGRTHSEQPQWSDCSKPRPLLSTLLWNTSYRNGVARLDGGWQHLHTKHKGVWDQFNGFSHLSLQAPPNTFLLKEKKKGRKRLWALIGSPGNRDCCGCYQPPCMSLSIRHISPDIEFNK